MPKILAAPGQKPRSRRLLAAFVYVYVRGAFGFQGMGKRPTGWSGNGSRKGEEMRKELENS